MSAQPYSESTLSMFTAADGDNIAVQDWPLPEELPVRGVVLLVHGLGEHAGRHDALARRLNGWGFAVRGYDQCGHGESGGARGCLPSQMRLVEDLGEVIESLRSRMPDELPLLLLGHSLGGLVAACFTALRHRPVQGLILSSPAFDPAFNPLQKLLVATLPRVAPNLTVGNGVQPELLSRNPAVVAAYRADRRVHDRISGRLARFIADTGPEVVARAPQWKVPTLLLYAGDDRVVDPQGSRRFAAAAPPALVTAKRFDGMYHEIFNEPDAERVYQALEAWLDAKF